MGSTQSSISDPKANWTGLLYIYPKAHLEHGTQLQFSHDDISLLYDLPFVDDKIMKISYYCEKLYDWQWWEGTWWWMHHAFVLIKTDNGYYWSIEKNDTGVLLRGSPDKNFLKKDRKDLIKRPSRVYENENLRCKMKHLIRFIQEGNELTKDYCWILTDANCKGFADRIIDKISRAVELAYSSARSVLPDWLFDFLFKKA